MLVQKKEVILSVYESIGTFRLWIDLGYAFGALILVVTADVFVIHYAIFLIGGLTIISSLIIKLSRPEQIKTNKEVNKWVKNILYLPQNLSQQV